MTLHEAQVLFCQLVGRLIEQATQLGYQPRLGEAWRSSATAALYAQQGRGIVQSLHCDRLALDLLLDKDGIYLTDSEAYRPLGEWWKTLHPLCRWGGDFSKPDGNHFSLSWGGRA